MSPCSDEQLRGSHAGSPARFSGRDRGVLPPRPRLAAVDQARGQPGAVLANPPERAPLGRRSSTTVPSRIRPRVLSACEQIRRTGGHLGLVLTVELDVQPGPPVGQPGDRVGAAARPHGRDDRLVHALHGGRRPASGSRARPRRHRPRRRSPAPAGPRPGRWPPAGRSRPPRPRRCPRCRPGHGPGRSRSPGAGGAAGSRRPGGGCGPARCGTAPGCPRPGRRSSATISATRRSACRSSGSAGRSPVWSATARTPSAVTISRDSTCALVRPWRTDRLPHASLPIIPPSVQRLCDDGSAPNVSPYGAAALRSVVEDDAGLDPGGARLRIDLQDPVHVAGEVQDDARGRRRCPPCSCHHPAR